MERNYVFVSHDTRSNAAQYLCYVGEVYKYTYNVNDTLRFTIEEVADIIKENTSLTWLGFSVVRIEDYTFERLSNKDNKTLHNMYRDFLYVAR